VLYPKIEKALLFDLANDPQEMADISDNPSHSPKLKYFFDELRDLQRVNSDPLDLIAEYP